MCITAADVQHTPTHHTNDYITTDATQPPSYLPRQLARSIAPLQTQIGRYGAPDTARNAERTSGGLLTMERPDRSHVTVVVEAHKRGRVHETTTACHARHPQIRSHPFAFQSGRT